jgi:hypothetical protein
MNVTCCICCPIASARCQNTILHIYACCQGTQGRGSISFRHCSPRCSRQPSFCSATPDLQKASAIVDCAGRLGS